MMLARTAYAFTIAAYAALAFADTRQNIVTKVERMQKQILIALIAAGTVGLSACTTINPYTQEEQTSKVVKGSAIGAAAGAIVGLLSSDSSRKRKERALKLAGIGAVAGGGVGYYMDVQEAKLRQELAETGVSVTRDGDNIILNMPSNITFASNRTDLRTDFVDVLGSVAKVLKEYKSTIVQVAGHTDSDGSNSYNQLLSQQRAQAVTDALLDFQVAPVRIETVGFGEEYPIASNSSAAGKAQNRRVELSLLPVRE